jgi:hypothetical protein
MRGSSSAWAGLPAAQAAINRLTATSSSSGSKGFDMK